MASGRSAGRRRGPVAIGRRSSSPWVIVGVVVVLLFAAAVGFGVYRAGRPATDLTIPPGATATGVSVGDTAAPATIDVYLDFQCPVFLTLLYANQTPENGAGLPDSELVTLGQQAGAGTGFAGCVADGRYTNWTASVTDAASRAEVTGTPTVLVDGRMIDNTDAALRQAVQAAGGERTASPERRARADPAEHRP